MDKSLDIHIEFGGGAELLFDNKKKYDVQLPSKETPWTIGDLLIWLKDNLLKDRPDLFLQSNSVRPGILVLVNDTDWELMDTTNYKLKSQDTVMFISTLHGG